MPNIQNVIPNQTGLCQREVSKSESGHSESGHSESGHGFGPPEVSAPAAELAPQNLELTAQDSESAVPAIHLQAVARIFAVGALRAVQAGRQRGRRSSHAEGDFSEEEDSHPEQEADATPAPKHPG